MPRVPDWMLWSSVYLYADEAAARAKQRMGGSGFIVGFPDGLGEPVEPPRPLTPGVTYGVGNWFYYVVTSRHVVSDRGAPVVRINTRDGRSDRVVLARQRWFNHPNADIAIAPVEVKAIHQSLVVGLRMVMSREQVKELDVGIGDDVCMVGRFINHEGEETNSPTLRFGNISMMPGLGLKVDDDPNQQEAYLIETRTVPGYSGSPVFLNAPAWEILYAPAGSERRRAGESGHVLTRLLGITGGWIKGQGQRLRVGRRDVASWRVQTNTGMMWCVPSYKLLELLNQPEVLEQREAQRKHWRDFPAAGAPA